MIHPRMKLFADEWLSGAETGKRFNGTAAYAFAGYSVPPSNAGTNASKLLRHPEVAAYIAGQMEEHSMQATEIMLRFTDIARAQVGECVVLDENDQLQLDHKKVVELSHLIKSYGVDSNGHPKIEFHDSVDALKQLTRIQGMFKDSMELGGHGGGNMRLVVEFVDPDGNRENLGPTNEVEEDAEDFSDLDAMSENAD